MSEEVQYVGFRYCAGVNAKWQEDYFGKKLYFHVKLNIHLPEKAEILLPGIQSREMKTCLHEDI